MDYRPRFIDPNPVYSHRRPVHCWSVNTRFLTSWRGGIGAMEIVALPGSTLLSLWSFQLFILSLLPYFFHSETVALRSCTSQSLESLSFQQASAQTISTVPHSPWYCITKRRSYPITFSNASHKPLFTRCTWFEVCHSNPLHPLQPHQQLIDGLLSQVQQWRIWCGWNCFRNSCNYNLLLKTPLRLWQCIVNCFSKGTQSNSGSGRTSHLNDIQYNIGAVALRSIVSSSGDMCGYDGDRSVGGNGHGCRRIGDVSGGHTNEINRRGRVGSFPPRGWWGSLIKFCGGRALMDVSAILLSLSLLEIFSHYIICRYL